jgi:hypothetical protein
MDLLRVALLAREISSPQSKEEDLKEAQNRAIKPLKIYLRK